MAKTYSQEITDSQVMLSGIKANQTALAARKIDEQFTSGLQSTIDTCVQLNNEQEQLKARLKEKTQELNEKMTELKGKTKEARKIVKLDMPQVSWKEFGILDKR